jgi:hypothetical protein
MRIALKANSQYSQSFCISMITSAVVFGSKELSCGHLYGLASMFESIFVNERVESVGVRNILCSGSGCARPGFFLSLGLEENVPKQFRRLRRKWFRVDVAGLVCFFSSLSQVDSGN